MTRYRGAN